MIDVEDSGKDYNQDNGIPHGDNNRKGNFL